MFPLVIYASCTYKIKRFSFCEEERGRDEFLLSPFFRTRSSVSDPARSESGTARLHLDCVVRACASIGVEFMKWDVK